MHIEFEILRVDAAHRALPVHAYVQIFAAAGDFDPSEFRPHVQGLAQGECRRIDGGDGILMPRRGPSAGGHVQPGGHRVIHQVFGVERQIEVRIELGGLRGASRGVADPDAVPRSA